MTRTRGILHQHQPICIFDYLVEFFVEWEMWQTKVVGKIKTHFLSSVTFLFSKIVSFFLNNVEKYCRVGQATDDVTAHAHCMLDTYGYGHTLRICNTYYFSAATVVARTRPQCYVIRTLPVLSVPEHSPLTHWGRSGSFKLFKRPFPGFLTILTL